MKKVVKNGKPGPRQAYLNSKKFDPNKYKLEKERIPLDLQDRMTSLCCRRCCEIISWKVNYGKYETLQRAKKCNLCGQKTVMLAYHHICQGCSKSNIICAKCQKKPDFEDMSRISTSDDQREERGNETSEFSFVNEVIDEDLSFLKGLDCRMLLKKLNEERQELESERINRLRERERRTILRKNEIPEVLSEEEI